MSGSVEAFLGEAGSVKLRRRRMLISIVLIVIGIHALGGVGATVLVVARYIFPPPATFEVKKSVSLPAKTREHKMNMQTFDSLAAKPSFSDKMLSARPAPIALPSLPKVTVDQMPPIDPSLIATDQITSLVGTAGVGVGSGVDSGFSFMGVQSTGKRVLLLFDVSTTVKNKASASGMPLEKIQEETLQFINNLPSSTRFGLIQFTQNYKIFRDELVPANDLNRETLRNWVEKEWVTTGSMPSNARTVTKNETGLLGVLKRAAQMQPDAVFIISDAAFHNRLSGGNKRIPWKDVAKAAEALGSSGQKVPVNFIGFQVKAPDASEMRKIVNASGGRYREMK